MSRLAVSNIAWSADEDHAAYELLAVKGVKGLEVAPPRFFPDIAHVSEAELRNVCAPIRENGLRIVALQAILFGKADLLLFDEKTRPALAFYLCKMAELCSRLGAKVMVFGAPVNRRIPDAMAPAQAHEIAVDFFRKIGQCAEDLGVIFGIEANPSAYQCNFCTHASDVVQLVREVDSPGVRWHLDAGELAMNNEKISKVIASGHDLICHVHLSEAMLAGFDQPWSGHPKMVQALEKEKYTGTYSIEMKRQPDGLEEVSTAIDFAQSLGIQ